MTEDVHQPCQPVEPFAGFRAFPTHHCVTGSMRHVYQLKGIEVSEELLLGLGAGVGFIYWHQKGQLPFLGGRANTGTGGTGKDGLEVVAGRRTGVMVTPHATASAAKARAQLLAQLSAGVPAMLQVDMGLLPYFDFPSEYHFGGHVVAAVGYDQPTGIAMICDRDTELHPVSLEALAAARGSTFRPFPPRHRAWTFDFTGQRPPHPDEIRAAIGEAARGMLGAPIGNLGVRGIRKAAMVIPRWPLELESEALTEACRNGHIMIDATGGTGGGLFRYLYARFLDEATEVVGAAALSRIGGRLHRAGDRWQDVASLFETASHDPKPAEPLSAIGPLLTEIADLEEPAWRDLLDASQT